jgi:hypothetical protein
MLDRLTPILRIVVILLAALLLMQLGRLMARRNSFAQINVGGTMAVSTNTVSSTNNPGPTTVPPEIAARVEKIKESQVLGMIVKPPPMALIGIAGSDVILRGPNGQTGIVRVGEELGGVKLLEIGVNRVLVLHEGKTNELILFQGFGSQSLLGKEKSK